MVKTNWETFIIEKYCTESIKNIKKILISDCDGILTDGNLGYFNSLGKTFKTYGCYDHEMIKLLKAFGWEILFVTNDKSGFKITQDRVNHLGCQLKLSNPSERSNEVIKYKEQGYQVAFFGDSPSDLLAASEADFRFTTANCFEPIKEYFQFVSKNNGGHGGFAECCFKLIQEFYYININET